MVDYKILSFKKQADYRQWLDTNHAEMPGVWLRIYKKATGTPTVTYAEALDAALCYGWIDGQRKGYDEVSFLQKFTPRRSRSLWSKRNIEYIQRLTDAGLMRPAGLAEVEQAKADGRWEAAYDSQRDMQVPEDFVAALSGYPKALATFETLNKSNKFAIGWRLQTAKTTATRERRMAKMIDTLNAGRTIV